MATPYFSIVTPALNEEKYLPKLLKSISAQNYKQYEVIIVDGKSDDRTKERFDEYKDKLEHAQFIESDKRNVGYQRNLGATRAKGKYLVFLDADCSVRVSFLKQLRELIEKEHFQFAYTLILPDSHKAFDRFLLNAANLGQEFASKLKLPLAGGYSMIVKRDIFKELGGFRPEVLYNEDYDFSLYARKKHIKLAMIKDPKVVYSMRRFRSEGVLKLLPKMFMGQLYMFFVGPITTDIFKYRMGGHVHKENNHEQPKEWILTTYKKTKKQLERNITRFLEA
jgi:glycosyltransferase involved in cell wall biosynthesis